MKVLCKFNRIKDILDPVLREKVNKTEIDNDDVPFPIHINQEYLVYGLELKEDSIFFSIFLSDEMLYPYFFNSLFFEVIDSRMSRFFRIKNLNNRIIINSKEWIEDQSFYEKILDDYPDEIKKYREYKKLIDSEFPNLRMQFTCRNNNISFFSNQFGILAGIANETLLEINKWYDVDIKFTNFLEYNVNYFINEDYELKSCIEDDRLIVNLKIEELIDEISDDNYIVNLFCYFNNCKIKIPVVPYAEEIKVGDYVKIKCDVCQIKIDIIDE